MTAFSPCEHGEALRGEQVQASLRMCFSRWGLPQTIRVDNGDPWGTQSLVPSALMLWCVGLGIQLHRNHPRRCTENGVVERGHGVLNQWSEPHNCPSLRECQQRLDDACRFQREVYPAIEGQSRLSAYPELGTNPRPYDPDQEDSLWQLQRVGHFLEQYRFDRRVDQVGRISLFSHDYTIGRPHRGKTVTAQFSQADWVWIVRDERGHVLKSLPGDLISQDNILHFRLAKRSQGELHVVTQEGFPCAA